MTWIWRVKPSKQLTQNQNIQKASNAWNHIAQKKVFDPETGADDPETGIAARSCRPHETPT